MMKPFDKRSVPGLEDFSSDSDDDNEIVNKKFRCDDEIELEVKNNEFLKEEPIENINFLKEEPIENIKCLKEEPIKDFTHKRVNSIWGNIVQDEILDESLKKCGVNRVSVKRSVESYTIRDESRHNRKRHYSSRNSHPKKNGFIKKEHNHKLPVKDRIIIRSFDKTKSRNHIITDPNKPIENVFEIARVLAEPKLDLIQQCYNVLGLDKCLEILYLTEDIEANGGLLVLDGSRRRSPGGVFLNLIKESREISPQDKRLIFMFNVPDRNQQCRNRINKTNRPNGSVIEVELIKPEKMQEIINKEQQPEISIKEEIKDEELEDGEIP